MAHSQRSGTTSSGQIPVLYVDNSSTFGGAINTLSDVVAELRSEGVVPIVVSGQPAAVLHQLFPDAATYAWEIPVPWVHGPAFRRLLRIAGPARRAAMFLRGLWWVVRHDLPDAIRLSRLGRRHSVRIVHLNNTCESQLSGLLAARLLGVPCVAHARGLQSSTRGSRMNAAMADVHVAISDVIAGNLRTLRVSDDRIAKVPDGIRLSEFHTGAPSDGLLRDLGIPEGAPVFGFFGRIVSWKGVREYVDAAALVLEALPDARALVVGDRSDGDESYAESIVERVRQLGLEDRILFTGYRSDVADLMRACTVVVHTSLTPEPFGLVVAEALATGTPVVASDMGGPTEIVDHGETGFLVDVRDREAVAAAVLRLLRNPDDLRRMGAVGRERMEARYSARQSASALLDVYAPLLEKKR